MHCNSATICTLVGVGTENIIRQELALTTATNLSNSYCAEHVRQIHTYTYTHTYIHTCTQNRTCSCSAKPCASLISFRFLSASSSFCASSVSRTLRCRSLSSSANVRSSSLPSCKPFHQNMHHACAHVGVPAVVLFVTDM